jgi:nucleotide-binding universal stress UspA family protein
MGEIVVGVDGSSAAAEVVSWAAEEAALRGGTLRVVSVAQSPSAWMDMGEALGGAVSATMSDADLEAVSMAVIDEALSRAVLPEHVELLKDARLGHPGDVLVRASSGADLLVVGSSGRGDIGSVLLGSVGLHCVHHAQCPVVVIPTKQRT